MKQFEMAEIEVVKFAMEDVITTSNPGENGGYVGGDENFGGGGEWD